MLHVLESVSLDIVVGLDGFLAESISDVDSMSVLVSVVNVHSVSADHVNAGMMSGGSSFLLVLGSVSMMSLGLLQGGLSILVESMHLFAVMDRFLPDAFSELLSHSSSSVSSLGGVEVSSGLVEDLAGVSVSLEALRLVRFSVSEVFSSDLMVSLSSNESGPGLLGQLLGVLMVLNSFSMSSLSSLPGSVPSGNKSLVGSSSVLGREVLVGSDESGPNELHVFLEVSSSVGLSSLEIVQVVEEGVVSEGGVSLLLRSRFDTVVPALLALTIASRNCCEATSLMADESLSAVLVAVTVSLA